jgi:hypothetical protein
VIRGKQTALMPGNEDKVGYWLTPKPLMDELQAEFDFDFDAAPYPRPAGFDGLKEPWGQRTWCNPPIIHGVSMTKWAKKAIAESSQGKLVAIVLPMPWWGHLLLEAGAQVRSLGRVRWQNPKGESRKNGGGGKIPDTLFILRPKVVA